MKARTLVVIVALSGAAMVAVQAKFKHQPSARETSNRAASQIEPRQWRDRVAPDFELTALDGSKFKLSDHIGKRAVVLNFFATWCGPCRAEMPELERYARSLGSEPFILIGVDAEERLATVARFITEMKTTFPIVIDHDGEVLKQYTVHAFPTTVVIGADGRVKLFEVGAIANADVSLNTIVKAELAVLTRGEGVSLTDYRQALAIQQPLTPESGDRKSDLQGRALEIATKMGCPCGCRDKVIECSCQTATGIKERLQRGDFGAKTDVDIVTELNNEFCGKGM